MELESLNSEILPLSFVEFVKYFDNPPTHIPLFYFILITKKIIFNKLINSNHYSSI